MSLRAAVLLLAALALTGCQSVSQPVADAKPAVTYGDWTVRTSGYVRAESAVVR